MASSLPASNYEQGVLAFASEAIREGDSFLSGQPGFGLFEQTIRAIMGEPDSAGPLGVTTVNLNHFGKVALDLVAALTDIKPFWDFQTFNTQFQQQAALANKLSNGWWLRRNIDLKQADVTKYALAMGTGYAHQVYSPDLDDIDVIPEDPRDVIPIRPGSLISIQDCHGVIIRRERTVNFVKARYPLKAHLIRPDREGTEGGPASSRVSTMLSAMGLRSSFVENLFASLGGRPKQHMAIPTVDLFTMYVNDDSTNDTGEVITKGLVNDQRTSWAYDVKPGERLYPRKRCIVFTRTAVLYDDTSIYWHGMFPLSKLTLDPWPWAWLGKAPLKDLLPLHAELQRLMRLVAQHHRRIERPGLAADKNSISRQAMDRIDTIAAGLKIRHNPIAGKGVELLHEPPLDASVMLERQFLLDQMDALAGNREMGQIANLNQLPTSETIDKIMESMPGSNRLRSRVLEVYIREFAMMALSNFFQFYTLPQRVAILGTSGMTFEDFDHDPSSMIPDMVDMLGHQGLDSTGKPIPLSRGQRAQTFLKFFTFNVAPGSLLASASISDKMMYVQLARMGAIDYATLLEKLNVPNIGVDTAGTTIFERLQAQTQAGITGNVGPAGRKATGQQSPRMVMKES